ARKLIDLAMPLGADPDETERKVDSIMEESGILLEDAQRDAVIAAVENGVLILTGGPGTGKTTTINALIRYFRKEGLEVALAAPTGRASKRMTEASGYKASTIHRLLEVSASDDDEAAVTSFGRTRDCPLEADVVIIDEMSMVDIFLFHALLEAIVPGTRLILVGDDNQLPSVGPGCVLRDILASETFPSVILTRIFRQAASSDIVVNAHRIHAGEEIKLNNDSRDFFFLKRDDPDRILRNTIELIRDRLPGYVGAKPYDIQVLSPMKKGTLGVDRINTILQRYLNPPGRGKREKEHGDRVFRTGDKVMQMRNNYKIAWETRGKYGIAVSEGKGIFNGDLGTIRDIRDYEKCMEIEFDEGRIVDYPYASLEDLELAYAATIHKSQGSEYPAVILPLLGGPRMLMTRNLLYTAVTRAKSCVVVIGSEEAVRGMISNDIERLRFTTLDERIREICGSGMFEL
ncbi:MAG: AAA family ATPase, partial [Lachnospiraceae bacterium]|nr:AAA family ATPase [Lachnospiraceae bacterium]